MIGLKIDKTHSKVIDNYDNKSKYFLKASFHLVPSSVRLQYTATGLIGARYHRYRWQSERILKKKKTKKKYGKKLSYSIRDRKV